MYKVFSEKKNGGRYEDLDLQGVVTQAVHGGKLQSEKTKQCSSTAML